MNTSLPEVIRKRLQDVFGNFLLWCIDNLDFLLLETRIEEEIRSNW
jgi:hypothetical protein